MYRLLVYLYILCYLHTCIRFNENFGAPGCHNLIWFDLICNQTNAQNSEDSVSISFSRHFDQWKGFLRSSPCGQILFLIFLWCSQPELGKNPISCAPVQPWPFPFLTWYPYRLVFFPFWGLISAQNAWEVIDDFWHFVSFVDPFYIFWKYLIRKWPIFWLWISSVPKICWMTALSAAIVSIKLQVVISLLWRH